MVALYNNVTLLSISKVLVNVEDVACSAAAGEVDAPERHPQSRLAGLKQE